MPAASGLVWRVEAGVGFPSGGRFSHVFGLHLPCQKTCGRMDNDAAGLPA